MIIKENLKFNNYKDTPVNMSLGTFDALHLGHQKVLKKLISESKKDNVKSVVFTFQNRPRNYFTGKKNDIVTPNDARKVIFKRLGINILVFIKFNKSIATMEPESFIKKITSLFKINKIIVGEDFQFGKNKKGNIELLKKLSVKYNYKITAIKKAKYKNRDISSSWIRQLIKEGDIKTANRILGREFFITGKVIKGKGIGREIGFPTLNLKLDHPDQILPSQGVYITKVQIGNKLYWGMTYFGHTRIKNRFVIETNIFDFNKNVYNKKISIFLIKKLRNDFKIIKLDELRALLNNDRKKALKFINRMEVKKR